MQESSSKSSARKAQSTLIARVQKLLGQNPQTRLLSAASILALATLMGDRIEAMNGQGQQHSDLGEASLNASLQAVIEELAMAPSGAAESADVANEAVAGSQEALAELRSLLASLAEQSAVQQSAQGVQDAQQASSAAPLAGAEGLEVAELADAAGQPVGHFAVGEEVAALSLTSTVAVAGAAVAGVAVAASSGGGSSAPAVTPAVVTPVIPETPVPPAPAVNLAPVVTRFTLESTANALLVKATDADTQSLTLSQASLQSNEGPLTLVDVGSRSVASGQTVAIALNHTQRQPSLDVFTLSDGVNEKQFVLVQGTDRGDQLDTRMLPELLGQAAGTLPELLAVVGNDGDDFIVAKASDTALVLLGGASTPGLPVLTTSIQGASAYASANTVAVEGRENVQYLNLVGQQITVSVTGNLNEIVASHQEDFPSLAVATAEPAVAVAVPALDIPVTPIEPTIEPIVVVDTPDFLGAQDIQVSVTGIIGTADLAATNSVLLSAGRVDSELYIAGNYLRTGDDEQITATGLAVVNLNNNQVLDTNANGSVNIVADTTLLTVQSSVQSINLNGGSDDQANFQAATAENQMVSITNHYAVTAGQQANVQVLGQVSSGIDIAAQDIRLVVENQNVPMYPWVSPYALSGDLNLSGDYDQQTVTYTDPSNPMGEIQSRYEERYSAADSAHVFLQGDVYGGIHVSALDVSSSEQQAGITVAGLVGQEISVNGGYSVTTNTSTGDETTRVAAAEQVDLVVSRNAQQLSISAQQQTIDLNDDGSTREDAVRNITLDGGRVETYYVNADETTNNVVGAESISLYVNGSVQGFLQVSAMNLANTGNQQGGITITGSVRDLVSISGGQTETFTATTEGNQFSNEILASDALSLNIYNDVSNGLRVAALGQEISVNGSVGGNSNNGIDLNGGSSYAFDAVLGSNEASVTAADYVSLYVGNTVSGDLTVSALDAGTNSGDGDGLYIDSSLLGNVSVNGGYTSTGTENRTTFSSDVTISAAEAVDLYVSGAVTGSVDIAADVQSTNIYGDVGQVYGRSQFSGDISLNGGREFHVTPDASQAMVTAASTVDLYVSNSVQGGLQVSALAADLEIGGPVGGNSPRHDSDIVVDGGSSTETTFGQYTMLDEEDNEITIRTSEATVNSVAGNSATLQVGGTVYDGLKISAMSIDATVSGSVGGYNGSNGTTHIADVVLNGGQTELIQTEDGQVVSHVITEQFLADVVQFRATSVYQELSCAPSDLPVQDHGLIQIAARNATVSVDSAVELHFNQYVDVSMLENADAVLSVQGVQNIYAYDTNDVISEDVGLTSSQNLFVDAGNGNDIVTTSGGDDELVAGEGADLLNGGAGMDTYDLTEMTQVRDVVVENGSTLATDVNGAVTGFDLILGFAEGVDVLTGQFAFSQHGYFDAMTRSFTVDSDGEDILVYNTNNPVTLDGAIGLVFDYDTPAIEPPAGPVFMFPVPGQLG